MSQLRSLRDTGDELAYEPAVWSEMVDMGWASIAIPEAYGGLGYGYTGLGVVLEQAGRHLSPSPLEGSVLLGATALLQLGSEAHKQEWLPRIAGGEAQVSVALQEGRVFDPLHIETRAEARGDGYFIFLALFFSHFDSSLLLFAPFLAFILTSP